MNTSKPNLILISAIAGTSLLALWSCDKGGSPAETTGRDNAAEQDPGQNSQDIPRKPRPSSAAAQKNSGAESETAVGVTKSGPGSGSVPPPPAAPSAPRSSPASAPGAGRTAPEAAPPAPEDPAVAQMQEGIRRHEQAMTAAIGASDLIAFERNYRAITKIYGDSPSSYFAALSTINDDLRKRPVFARAFFDQIAENPQAPALAAGFIQGLGDREAQRNWLRTVQNAELRQKVAGLAGLEL